MRSALILCVVALLAGCAVGPDYKRPKINLPESTLLSGAQQQNLAYWWTRYRDPTLNRLIQEALDSNLQIAEQFEKVREARAELGYENAQLYPTIDAQANAMREREGTGVSGGGSEGGGSGGSGGSGGFSSSGSGTGMSQGGEISGAGKSVSRYNYFSFAGTLNYELDIWGALRRASQQARAELLASAYTEDSVRLMIATDVVTNYVSLRSYQAQIKITKQTIRTREQGFALDQKRYKYGAIDKLTLLQTQSLLNSARANLPPLELEVAELQTSLALLTGKTPAQIIDQTAVPKGSIEDLTLPQNLPKLLPSSLLNRRPDIRAAEAELIAANANVGVAKAQFFPTFNLSALIGTRALQFDNLFEPYTKVAQIGGSMTAPILDFGRINAQYRSAKAKKAQAEIEYRQTVRQAFEEVKKALAEVKYSRELYLADLQQVQSYRETLHLAKLRYQVGRTNYFDVLDAERNLYSSQLSLASAIAQRFTATADLFKALGGGWTQDSNSLSPALEAVANDYAPPAGEKNGKNNATRNAPVPDNGS